MSGSSGMPISLPANEPRWQTPCRLTIRGQRFPTPPLTHALTSEYSAGFWGFRGMTRTTRRVGIVLFQLGGPDTLEAIQPFLYNLFSDPDIIDFPFARIGRQPLARLIAARRAKHVAH